MGFEGSGAIKGGKKVLNNSEGMIVSNGASKDWLGTEEAGSLKV